MSDPIVGFRYYFGIHMGISRGPVDELVEIKVGDRTAWRGSVTSNTTINIDKPELFGGEEGEGGIQGPLTVMMGGPTQTAPSELNTVLATPMPGFRGMFTAFFNGIVSMMNPYPKPWKFRVRRTLAGWDGSPWYPEKATISLTRPVSAAETAETFETVSVNTSESGLQSTEVPGGSGNFAVNLSPPAAITSVFEVRLIVALGSGESETVYTLTLLPTNYSFSGSVLTIINNVDFNPNVVIGSSYYGYEVNYTYTLTTVNPLLGVGDALIQAMNPIHILYESYTNRQWSRGLPSSALDDVSWRAAADTLFAERFGLCIRWTRRDGIKAFQQGILDHIGAVIYPDRTTAKIKIKLIRDDYARGDIPLYDTQGNGLLAITEEAVSASGPMINEVRVVYRDPVTNEDRTVRASNVAGVQGSGGSTNSITREYKGLPTAELASRVAKRDLRAMSPSIRRYKVILDRRAYKTIPGGLIRIKDAARGIPDTVLRVGTVDYGKHGEGEIEVVGVEDVFGLPSKALIPMPPPTGGGGSGSGGGGAGGSPPCLATHRLIELPYRTLRRALNAADFAFLENDSAYLGTLLMQGQPLNNSYRVAVKPGAISPGEEPADLSYFCSGFAPPSNRVQLTLAQPAPGGAVSMTIAVISGTMSLADYRMFGNQAEGYIQFGVSLACDIVGSNFYVTDAAVATGSMTLTLNPGWAVAGRVPFNLADAATLTLEFIPSYGAGPWTQINMAGQGLFTQVFCLTFPALGRDDSFLSVTAASGACAI